MRHRSGVRANDASLEELAQADALAFDVPWDSSYGEERQVLVTLAVLHAPADAAPAARSSGLA